ncbi:hypothetical protein [Bacillus inaquosorum]|uniref:hypothetical protein n=1 Tax=Bacillus inaquosorum TaxID=483913 RepID=UPI0022801FC8|nr:hypothetical protein [Bacillus inaquosorum]MCY8282811.1 hypothetical protein [Bacillus inaquosorum]MCY9456693.1 hypothetical protein [Bacillus inaquosorum]
MKNITKEKMMQYRFNGRKYIEQLLKKHSIQNSELKRQVHLNIEEFDKHADSMKMSQSKPELREKYIALVQCVRTIELIMKKQKTVLSMLPDHTQTEWRD